MGKGNKMKIIILVLFCFPLILQAQSGFENTADNAYKNAEKGIYWAFKHIPDAKNKISHDLVFREELLASVKLTKQLGGVKVESTGFKGTTKVLVVLFRSYKLLKDEGYLKGDIRQETW